MREEKFEVKENSYENDDIQYAFDYNGLHNRLSDIETIVAEVCGDNDGCDWHWILKMKNGKFSYASGGCDYTGWDCRSSADITDKETLEEALMESPETDYYQRNIRDTLRGQIEGRIPFATYVVDYRDDTIDD